MTEGRIGKAAFVYKERRNTSLKRNWTQNISKVINFKLEEITVLPKKGEYKA